MSRGKVTLSRNTGIDCLRILSMYMVVILHINGLGGIMTDSLGVNRLISYGIEQLCFVAVNLFALISGYCSYGKKHKIKNIIGLWLQVFFYSVSITVILFAILGPNTIPLRKTVGSMLPVLTNRYWYFTSYLFLFFLMPALNLLIEKSQKRPALLCISFVILLCSIDGIITDLLKLNGGYSVWWLAVVYTVGAFCKKYEIGKGCCRKSIFLGMYFTFSLLGLGCTYLLTIHLKKFNTHLYSFPLILLASVSVFLFFANINIKPSNFITKVSSASFAIYIIHMHPILFDTLLRGKFERFTDSNPIALLGILLLIPACIYVVCTIIELLRQQFFRLIGIDRLLAKIQNKSDDIYKKFIEGYKSEVQ